MDDSTKKTLARSLKDLDSLMDEMDLAMDSSEGEVRSNGNTRLARLLGGFGVEVAHIEDAARRAKDYYDNLKSQKIVALIEDGTPVTRTDPMVKVDPEVTTALDELRKLEHSVDVLQRKSKSGWAYLDQSRSRLSWVSKDRSA